MSDDIRDRIESDRFQEIMDLKRHVFETKDEIDHARSSRGFSEGDGIELYHRKVRDYIISIETVLNPAGEPPSDYWSERHIGSFELPNGEVKQIDGLEEFVLLPTSFDVEREQTVQRSYRHKRETQTVVQTVRPPMRLVEQAFRMANQAMGEKGYDIGRGSDGGTAEFDKIDDVRKMTEIWEFLKQLNEPEQKEVIAQIQTELLAESNGQYANGEHD